MYSSCLPGGVDLAEVRVMTTGDHTTSVSCAGCATELGWKYVKVPSQEPEVLRKLNHYAIGDELLATGTAQCRSCSLPILATASFLDDGFVGLGGDACMYKALLPGAVKYGAPEVVAMITGDHTSMRVSCVGCATELGWKYIKVPSQEPEFLRKLNHYVIGDSLIEPVKATPRRDIAHAFEDSAKSLLGTDPCTCKRTPCCCSSLRARLCLSQAGWDAELAQIRLAMGQS